ncbi:MAG: DNA mismatch endonuclease Vsr [Alphaproteobacteria bacterium]|nr:DNA mismatch endonuclease Vsr [Alphaproteobacteria bacterium]
MPDIVDKATRSRMMAAIKGKNTKPEILVRKALHAAGFRFRLHDKKLPGKPDIVLPKYKTVIFVHGCFWHGHRCKNFRWPKTRATWWEEKITGNQTRDKVHLRELKQTGWKILTIWECQVRRQFGGGTLPRQISRLLNKDVR